MDRLVSIDLKEIELLFKPNQKITKKFQLTNLMHTMSVAISLTTTNPSLFSFNHSFSVLSPLSSSHFTLFLSQLSDLPSLSSPPDSLLVRTTILPTGKVPVEDLRRLFSLSGSHIFKDVTIPISFVGHHVVEFLLTPSSIQTLETSFLLSKAISVCTQTQIDSLLRSVVQSGKANFVSSLIDAGGDVNLRDSNGKSLMSLPVNSGNLNVVKALIQSGCVIDDSIDWFLHDAAAINRVDLMEVLCSSSSVVNSVNSVDSSGRTPVHVGAFHGHLDVLRFCVSMGCELDCVDVNGWTPLHCAASKGHTEVVDMLLECCYYTKYAIDRDGKTPFLLAIDNGHSHLLNSLRLVDVLHRAARLDDVHGMKNCFTQGAEVNCRDQNGWTPLHRAAFKGHIESVKLLVNQGAQVDLVDEAGYTPLHCAVEAGHMHVALFLIRQGACASIKSIKGVCPLNLDSLKNHPALVFSLCDENIEKSELELNRCTT